MKINDEQLKVILGDLYIVEPNLAKYEKELEQIIREIIDLRPEVRFDENFRQRLRTQLIERAAELEKARSREKVFLSAIFGQKFSYALVGSLAIILVIAAAGYFGQKQGLVSFNLKSVLPGQQQPLQKIVLDDNAFGSLVGEQQVNSAPQGLGGFAESSDGSAVGFGIGGGGTASVSQPSSLIAPDGRGGGMMIYPSVVYKYVYKGEPLALESDSVEVLRRRGFDRQVSGLTNFLDGFNVLNIGSFGSLGVQNVSLAEDRDFGYIISYNIEEGSVYISQNWSRWPQPYKLCSGEALCLDQNRVKISEILPDSETISIAKNFAASHGINLNSYGEPEVTDTWSVDYERMADKSGFYLPESANVLFPLKINGQFVYDEGGNKTGLNVSVDHRLKKVSGVGNITSQSYESSNYAAETDAAKILKVVQQCGYWGYGYPMPMTEKDTTAGARELELEVGTSRVEYVAYSNYSNGKMNFLLVPSLIFPITKNPQDVNYHYPKNIVVPLAKELLDQRLEPPYRIM